MALKPLENKHLQARRVEIDLEGKLSQYGRMANTYQYGAKGETGLSADQVNTDSTPQRSCRQQYCKVVGAINAIC